AGVREDEMNGLARELEIDRHCDQARAHDAEIGGNELGAIGRENADAIPAREAALGQCTRHAIRHAVDLAIGEFARRLLAAEINDRDLVEVAIAPDEVAEIGECGHRTYESDTSTTVSPRRSAETTDEITAVNRANRRRFVVLPIRNHTIAGPV